MIAISDFRSPAETETRFMERLAGQAMVELLKGGARGGAIESLDYRRGDFGRDFASLVVRSGTITLTVDHCRAFLRAKREKVS